MTTNTIRQLLIPQQLNKNNFDCIRFFLVIDTEPVNIFTRNQIDLCGIAVSFFFGNIAHRLFFISLPLTFGTAYLSWNFVESPFLKMKKHLKDIRIAKPKRTVSII